MTTLAIDKFTPFMTGLNRPGSGKEAGQLSQIFRSVIHHKLSGWSERQQTITALSVLNQPQALGSDVLADCSTISLANRFLAALPVDLAEPEIGIDPDGEVSFDWFGPAGRNFSVSLRDDGRVAYAGAFGPGKTTYGTDIFIDEIPAEIMDAVRKLARTGP